MRLRAPGASRSHNARVRRSDAVRNGQCRYSLQPALGADLAQPASARFSSWRTRSRLTPRCTLISSSVCESSVPSPKRWRTMNPSRGGSCCQRRFEVLAERRMHHLGFRARLGAGQDRLERALVVVRGRIGRDEAEALRHRVDARRVLMPFRVGLRAARRPRRLACARPIRRRSWFQCTGVRISAPCVSAVRPSCCQIHQDA